MWEIVELAQLAAQLPAIHLRHHDIEDGEVYFYLVQFGESVQAVLGLLNLEAGIVEEHGGKLADMGIIVDDQDSAHEGVFGNG